MFVVSVYESKLFDARDVPTELQGLRTHLLALRTYSVKEMNDLVESLTGKDQFEWKIGKVKSSHSKVLYLKGIAKNL